MIASVGYVSEAEANGVETRVVNGRKRPSTIPSKRQIPQTGNEICGQDKALEVDLQPVVGGPIVAKMVQI
jgi:hypothetical protein